jgi:sn-glycerol 3-phosphate transport system permease protein
MIAPTSPSPRHRALETLSAWVLALLWLLPLLYALWTAFHPAAYATRFVPDAPLTLQNFANAWQAAPFRATSSTPSCW